jgi:transketolase
MEQLKNHHGKNSVLVLRPADSYETTVAWKMALENTDSPTALLFSRQNIPAIPAFHAASRSEAAKGATHGAYIVKSVDNPDLVMVANGSEVATLLEGAAILEKEKGLKVQVVSAISEGIFRNQDKAYQEKVLPSGKPTFGLTAGLPSTLRGLVGANGTVIGLDHFGYSAPYNVLDEKFGFTGANVAEKALVLLQK